MKLYRGTSNTLANKSIAKQSAGGAPRTPDVGRPTKEQVQDQVGRHEGAKWKASTVTHALRTNAQFNLNMKTQPLTDDQRKEVLNAIADSHDSPELKDKMRTALAWTGSKDDNVNPHGVTEYTTNFGIANSFASQEGKILEAHIDPNFLARGSVSEGGWVVKNGAPADVKEASLTGMLHDNMGAIGEEKGDY